MGVCVRVCRCVCSRSSLGRCLSICSSLLVFEFLLVFVYWFLFLYLLVFVI